MDGTIIAIPAYEPGTGLLALVSELRQHCDGIVVVDDGSTAAAEIFAQLEDFPGVTLLRHAQNRGKGAALKTAFAYIRDTFPASFVVVTADADGQHLPRDIRRIADAARLNPGRMILGTRTFRAGTPFRSRLGNLWTCGEFFLLTGVRIADTQTGLRAFPAGWINDLLAIPGHGYGYECRMLVASVRAKRIPVQVPIETVYLDGNSTSHFKPLADTFRTQAALFAARFAPLPRGWSSR